MLIFILAAAAPPPPPPPEPPMTAREAVEIPLASQAEIAPMTGAEAARIRKRYLDRIGVMIEPKVDTATTSARR